MIENVEITNFKGIKHCSIDQLARINLFVGKNNSCKSTILEGIYYSLKEMGDSKLREIFGNRTNVFVGMSELWYNYVKEEPMDFRIGFRDVELQLALTFNKENHLTTCTPRLFEKTTNKSFSLSFSQYYLDWGQLRRITYQDYVSTMPTNIGKELWEYIRDSLFLDSVSKKDVSSIERLLGTVKSSGMSDIFGEYLFTIFGQGRRWEFLPSIDRQGEYRAATYIDGVPLFLSGLGDGMRYALQIVGNSIFLKNTGIFIEEIESNQHPESLGKLIPFLVKLSKDNNLQLFITTQSISLVWGYLEKEFPTPEEREQYFRCFYVHRDTANGQIRLTPQSKEDQTTYDSDLHRELYGN